MELDVEWYGGVDWSVLGMRHVSWTVLYHTAVAPAPTLLTCPSSAPVSVCVCVTVPIECTTLCLAKCGLPKRRRKKREEPIVLASSGK